jgi:predicted GH43/DUF377 family glycosyl hydrolase
VKPKTMGIALTSILGGVLLLLFNNFSSPKDGPVNVGGVPIGPDFSKLTPTCFVANPANPILTSNSLLQGADWNDPSVLKVGNSFVMYATSDQNFDGNIKIYRLLSTDGSHWALNPTKAVFQANAKAGAWDHRAVETPSVIFFNGKYHMFYTGYPTNLNDSSSYKIGHAVSSNGISWTRDANFLLAPTNPSGDPNFDFNQYVVGEPGAVVFNGKIHLYFSALGVNQAANGTLQVIGLTTSSDGVHWSPAQSALSPDQSIYPRSSWLGFSTPQPVVLNGQVHLFFDVVEPSPWRQVKLHHASSADGFSNWNQDTQSNFSASDFNWTSREILAPTVLLNGTDLLMWFAGNNGSTLGIGLAKCSLQ